MNGCSPSETSCGSVREWSVSTGCRYCPVPRSSPPAGLGSSPPLSRATLSCSAGRPPRGVPGAPTACRMTERETSQLRTIRKVK